MKPIELVLMVLFFAQANAFASGDPSNPIEQHRLENQVLTAYLKNSTYMNDKTLESVSFEDLISSDERVVLGALESWPEGSGWNAFYRDQEISLGADQATVPLNAFMDDQSTYMIVNTFSYGESWENLVGFASKDGFLPISFGDLSIDELPSAESRADMIELFGLEKVAQSKSNGGSRSNGDPGWVMFRITRSGE